jgi:DNA-binding cell septation regulator SpoVG
MIESIRFERVSEQSDGRSELLATASISFRVGSIGRFVVHGVKIVRTADDRYIVSMPSSKRYSPCSVCNRGTPVMSRYCCNCGHQLSPSENRSSYYADIFHPLDQVSRMNFEAVVLQEYHKEFVSV